MHISRWLDLLSSAEFGDILEKPISGCALWQLIAADARPAFIAKLFLAREAPLFVVVPTNDLILKWQAKLILAGVNPAQIFVLPSGISNLFDDSSQESVSTSERLNALSTLANEVPAIILGTAAAALERTLPVDVLRSVHKELVTGETQDIDGIVKYLMTLGYTQAEPVRLPGQFSKRGGILDIFAVGAHSPIRVEFFDDSIESIRHYDPNTQRSNVVISSISLLPNRETMFHFGDLQDADELVAARKHISEMLQHAKSIESAELDGESALELELRIGTDAESIAAGKYFERLDLYRPLLHPDSGCAIGLLSEKGIVVIDELEAADTSAEKSQDELREALQSRHHRGEILRSHASDYVFSADALMPSGGAVIGFMDIGAPPNWFEKYSQTEWKIESLVSVRGQAEALTKAIIEWTEQGYVILFATDQPVRAKTMLGQVEIYPAQLDETNEWPEKGLFLATGNLAGGFISHEKKFVVITDYELFGVGRLKVPTRRFNEGVPITTVLDLKEGDYVVHIHYGIGIFMGLVNRVVQGVEKEFLFIQYAAPDKLYVPVDQLDRVQKYLSPGDAQPKIHRLQGGEWRKAVGKAREEARNYARDLIQLYARRKRATRPKYSPDTPWQQEMESTFPWQETHGQLAAIQEIKQDLQTDYPMDRLVCGDVGFGKTEVAIRAAFKVALEGKQVAILCPTTILSEQHYRTFSERLSGFSTRLDYINRFRTTADRKQILKKVEEGTIDILIGTHALLSKELKFANLGLVIIDEEHKFGVKQKEVLKELRVNIDVLSMSATPIPRTLSMALMDIRQMSMINDPPPGRLPIRTHVRSYSAEVTKEAILRELARGGQVYYVFNRVSGIFHVAEKIKKLVPMARIGVAHGQMAEQEIEPIMAAFVHGELDVLISTTIIENGLDIPNANTLIVENADKVGMSQLYQLRGRIGRSDRQAYAYLMYQSEDRLSENAQMRLQALQEFSTLGSGYSLAFRDLQIRGAGDLLGANQSGTMAAIGYELFVQIINEEVLFLKSHADDSGERREYRDPLQGLEPLPIVDVPVSAFLPEWYVSEQAQRLFYYTQIMSSRTQKELNDHRAEVVDRYGRLPEEAEKMFAVLRLRILAAEQQINKIDGNGGRLAVNFSDDAEMSPRLISMLAKSINSSYFSRDQWIIPFTGPPIPACEKMIQSIVSVKKTLDSQREALGLS